MGNSPGKRMACYLRPLGSSLETIPVRCNDVILVIPESDISSHQSIQFSYVSSIQYTHCTLQARVTCRPLQDGAS